MQILVVGSSGFIGSHLTPVLRKRGHEVTGFDRKQPVDQKSVDHFVLGDVRDKDAVKQALAGKDALINLAAVHFDFGHSDEEYWETNEGGAKAVTEALTETGVNRFLFTSSIAVYGDRTDEACEETKPAPTSVYGASKLGAEKVVEEWAAADPAHAVVVLRPCVVYGERNVTNMLNLIRQINSGYFILFGSGKNVKATAYVANLVAAIAQNVEDVEPGLKRFNYADKPDLTVREIVTIIRTALGKKPAPLTLPLTLGTIAALPFDLVTKLTGKNFPVSSARVSKLAQPTMVAAQRIREAGFQQPVSSEEGLKRMVAHFRETRTS